MYVDERQVVHNRQEKAGTILFANILAAVSIENTVTICSLRSSTVYGRLSETPKESVDVLCRHATVYMVS